MLIRYAVSNFMSFKDQTIFSMAAGKATHHRDHIINCKGKRILKGGFIFGLNAGGKSNLIRSILFAQNIVLKGLNRVNCEKKYFRIDPEYKKKPGTFQFDIFSNGVYYSYGFSVSYSRRVIVEEWLYRLKDSGQDLCIFHLKRDSNDITDIDSRLEFRNKEDQKRFDVYCMDIKAPKMADSLFLSDTALRSSDSKSFEDFLNVYDWFNKLFVLFPSSHFKKINYLAKRDEIRKFLAKYLNHFDTGIEQLETREIPLTRLLNGVPEKNRQELLSEIEDTLSKNKSDNKISFLNNRNGDSMLIEKKEDGLFATRLVADHGNAEDLFDLSEESDGTQRLYDLIPLYTKARDHSVIIIDELDRSFHSKLTIEFIHLFYKKSGNDETNYSQLIATTQDSSVLNLKYLRQDEIWFVERAADHSSHLYSLNKFKTRFDKDVQKAYLIGRYGAVPVFSQMDDIQEDP